MKLSFLYLIILAIFSVSSITLNAQSYEDMIAKSYEYVDNNDLFAAEETLKAAMRLEPANRYNYALLTNLGTVQRRQGKFDDAVISYTAALSQQPKSDLILRNRAETYAEMGKTENALLDYETLLSINPLDEDALYNRGLLYIQTENFLLAEADFERVLELNPETEKGRMGFAILEKVRRNYSESEIIFNYLIDKNPRNWRLYEERAELYFLMDKKGRAMSDLNKVFAEVAEPSAELYVLRGRVKLAQYEKESAAIDFKKAQELGYDAETIATLLKQSF
ncbi:MAG: tetratricopeptide repeat protein [Tannerella sp.]|jgi:tetratricopeptide (TPR) repeat protein|nr:tetratricopeptide repeat protein [Tannerella sp.]